jgi:HPt (histidine-containing phosphotransfer) domain-containing protein
MTARTTPAKRAFSYKRLANQCTDAQQLLKSQKISSNAADEIAGLARLLLASIDLHCPQPPLRINAAIRTERAEAQSAIQRLRQTIRAISAL